MSINSNAKLHSVLAAIEHIASVGEVMAGGSNGETTIAVIAMKLRQAQSALENISMLASLAAEALPDDDVPGGVDLHA